MIRGRFTSYGCGVLGVFFAGQVCALEMPTIKDPFSTQKKIAPYGANLKPASCPTKPDTSKPLALNTVVLTTICDNPDARAAYLSLLASADSHDGTIMSYLPDITSSATGSKSRSRADGADAITRSSSLSASTSMTLFDFGRREASLAIAERSLAAAGLSYDSTLQGFIASSLQNYFKLLTSQNTIDIERESLKVSKLILDAAETRYTLGLVPLSDALQARTSYAQAELNMQQADNTLALNRAALAQLMGFAPLTDVQVDELDDSNLLADPFKSELAALIEKAKTQRTDLKTKKLQLENAEDSLKNTKRRNLPTIAASASRSYADWDLGNNSTTHTDTIGVTVTVPIFTGFGQIFSERSQRKQLEAQRLQLTQSERDVEQDVLRSWQNYTTSKTSYTISRATLASARQLKEVSLGRYKEGLGSILDVLNAQISYRNALQNHLSSRYSLLTARVDLVRSVGELDLSTLEPSAPELPPLASVVSYKDPTPTQGTRHEIP